MTETLIKRRIDEAHSVAELAKALEFLINSGCRIWTESDGTKILTETRARVDQVNGLKIEIYAKEHAPPHFHVTAADIDATFSIETGVHLRGKISNKDEELVRWWYQRSKEKLVAFWNETRPSNCPIGRMKE